MPKKRRIKQPEIYKQQGGVGISALQYESHAGNDTPTFCFKFLHSDYSLSCCADESNKNFTKGLLKKLETLTKLTWSEIQLTGRRGAGSEKIPRSSIVASIPSQISTDIKDFLSFYYAGDKGRIIGFRGKDTIFHVVYIDTKLKVYTH